MNSFQAADTFRNQQGTPLGEVPCSTLARGVLGPDGVPGQAGFLGAPIHYINVASYTLTLADQGKKLVLGPSAAAIIVPAYSAVPFPADTVITLLNMQDNTVTISITSDTMTLIPDGTTASVDLAQYGQCTLQKSDPNDLRQWAVSGNSALS